MAYTSLPLNINRLACHSVDKKVALRVHSPRTHLDCLSIASRILCVKILVVSFLFLFLFTSSLDELRLEKSFLLKKAALSLYKSSQVSTSTVRLMQKTTDEESHFV